MSKSPRVRFAPSPSGALHIGSLRTALFNWLFARRHGGSFILRIEDTDSARSTAENEDAILSTLTRLGLTWDEGPFRQSERRGIYEGAIQKLKAAGHLYPCFCTPDELEAERAAAMAKKRAPRYSGKCKRLEDVAVAERITAGNAPAYRFRVEPQLLTFQDGVRGSLTFNTADIGDFIAVRSDGSASFYLASAVDDHEMAITDVIRGEDHLSNTPRQILLLKALGAAPPTYHHLPLIIGADEKKLSKREGALDVGKLLDTGYLPESINSAVATLGWSGADGARAEKLEEMARRFDIRKVGKSPARFDTERLDAINSHRLKSSAPETLHKLFTPLIEKGALSLKRLPPDKHPALMSAIAATIHTPTDVVAIAEQFLTSPEPDRESGKLMADEAFPLICQTALTYLADSANPDYKAMVNSITSTTGIRGKKLFMPLRAALTGRTIGPELKALFDIVGPDEIAARLTPYAEK